MDILKNLFSNPTMIRVATDKLRSLFTDDGIQSIVLRLNPHNLQPPLPGFDVLLNKEEVEVFRTADVRKMSDQIERCPYAITELENAQFEALKKLFIPDYANMIDLASDLSDVDKAALKSLKPTPDAYDTYTL